MWMSNQTKTAAAKKYDGAALGVVTAGGHENGVYMGLERRALPVAAPGGYCWRPKVGQQVLVLKSGAHGESAWVLAQPVDSETDLLPGEVKVSGVNCSLKLTSTGCVELCGNVSINGSTLNELIRSAVAQALAQEG